MSSVTSGVFSSRSAGALSAAAALEAGWGVFRDSIRPEICQDFNFIGLAPLRSSSVYVSSYFFDFFISLELFDIKLRAKSLDLTIKSRPTDFNV